MKYALLSILMLLAACSSEAVVDRYEARIDSETADTCTAESCGDGVTKSFATLDPLYQLFLVLTFPFWSMGG